MTKLYRIFLYLFAALLLFFSGGTAVTDFHSEQDTFSAQPSVTGNNSGKYATQRPAYFTHHYKIKVKPKIKVRFRARYCYFDLPPVFRSVQEFIVADQIGYSNSSPAICSRDQFSFRLRGPPTA